jgi:hypothetical protein
METILDSGLNKIEGGQIKYNEKHVLVDQYRRFVLDRINQRLMYIAGRTDWCSARRAVETIDVMEVAQELL